MQSDCKNCLHFKEAPYGAAHTGCWHPDNLRVSQKEAFLDQQQLPGDHKARNFSGQCTLFEGRPSGKSLWQRIMSMGA